MEHELKTLPGYFQDVYDGIKTFEVRRKDRPFAVGDTLILREFLPELGQYTGSFVMRRITYILDDPDYCKAGFVILGMKPIPIAMPVGREA